MVFIIKTFNMRPDIELLTVLRDNIDKSLITGLCKLNSYLYFTNKFNVEEARKVIVILHNNPTPYNKSNCYYFEKGNKPLRKAYLTRLIKKLKTQ